MNSLQMSTIPVIDFSPFIDGSESQSAKKRVAAQMLDSFKSTGFVYLTNFGMPDEEVARMFDWSKRFFTLPLETKNLAPHPKSGTHHRGYSSPGREQVVQLSDESPNGRRSDTPKETKESFECGREEDQTMTNIWLPEGILPGFKEQCLEFFWRCYKLEKTILCALAIGFGLDEEWFLNYHTRPDNQLRLLRYPSISLASIRSNELTRIAGHSDYVTITILFQDDIGGLEVEDPNAPGTFFPVPPVQGSIVVNAGDFLQRWSNDTIRSAVHRVRAPQPKEKTISEDKMVPERYSIPYFCPPDYTANIDVIPGTWSEEKPKKYGPISPFEYVMERLAANY